MCEPRLPLQHRGGGRTAGLGGTAADEEADLRGLVGWTALMRTLEQAEVGVLGQRAGDSTGWQELGSEDEGCVCKSIDPAKVTVLPSRQSQSPSPKLLRGAAPAYLQRARL